MTVVIDVPEPTSTSESADDDAAPRPGRWERWFGPLTPLKMGILLVAVLFLGSTAGYAFRDRESQASSAADVGFLRDMSTHHNQAVVIARTALDGGLPDGVDVYAQEIIVGQQFEFGLMQATLYRYNEEPEGDGTAMAWMGMPVPEDEMPGLASGEELSRLEELDGEEAAALFFALMSRHHLGGAHMAEAAAEDASDPWVRQLADRMYRSQTSEIQEYRTARARLGIGLPDGYPETPQIRVPPERRDESNSLLLPVGLALLFAALVIAGIAWAGAGRIGSRRDDSAGDDAEESDEPPATEEATP